MGCILLLVALVGEVLALYKEELEDTQKTNMVEEDMHKDNITQKLEMDRGKMEDMQKSNRTEQIDLWGECRAEVWGCLSTHMEEVVRGIHGVSDLLGSLHLLLLKATFHGSLKSMWSSVVEVPQARRLFRCLNRHDACVTHATLSRWAWQESVFPFCISLQITNILANFLNGHFPQMPI